MHTSSDLPLDGSTRVYYIVGDPIAQVKSPAGATRSLMERGRHAIVVPAHVAPGELAEWVRGASLARNVDGILFTVPHKQAALALCATATERARFVGAVNVVRRNRQGSWHGDMCDGEGYLRALQRSGCEVADREVLLVGAGGAGSAIAYALVLAGVRRLAIHDADTSRRDSLVAQLAVLGRSDVVAGSDDPTGFHIVINATPMGMRADDPLPVQAAKLVATQSAGCVITAPPVSPWLEIARAQGCTTLVGADMFTEVKDLLLEFLLEQPE